MVTETHSKYAHRLAESCKQFGMSFTIHVVPMVHQSISLKGGTDIRYTKANFIAHLLREYQKPVLYLDADCYFESYPEKIAGFVDEEVDFAIYNWVGDWQNATYQPVPLQLDDGSGERLYLDRFYVFLHSVNFYAPDQLHCAGAVQYWGNTDSARALLRLWQETIARFPRSADDECLTFAYNNEVRGKLPLKAVWLDKAYARYAWWIYVQPVINHPDFPSPGLQFEPISPPDGRKPFYDEQARFHPAELVFPGGSVIDIETGTILKPDGNRLVPSGTYPNSLWR